MTSNALALAQKVSILASSSGASTTTYANPTDLPTAEVTTGAMAYVSASNKLYMWNGTAWFNIAIVNQAPTAITGNQATYFLSKDGTPTVVTLVSTDPEGLPLTWSSSTSGDTQVGTVTNTDNVFTITPSTDGADIGTLSVTFSVTDGNNTETSVSSFTLEFLSPYWNETVLSIGTSSTNGLANNTFIDRSTNAHTVTPAGTSVQTAFHPYLENWGVEFDGSGDYLSVPSSTDFAFGTGDFTVEFWYYRTATPSTTDGLVSWNYLSGVHIAENTAGIFLWVGGTQIFQPSTKTVLNSWNHVAVSRSGSTVKLFVNGAEVDSASSSQSVTANALYIGASSHATSEAANGYISNVRLLKGTALYTTNFTPPTEKLTAVAGTSLLTCQSNRFVDNSSNAHTITPTGNVEISAFNPFGQGSEYAVGENKGSTYFDGDGDYLTLADTTAGAFGTDDFTLEFWIYNIGNANSLSAVLTTYNGNNAAKHWGLQIDRDSEGNIYWYYSITLGINSSVKLNKNTWTHIAVVRNSSTTTMYVNGVSGGSFSDNTNYVSPSGLSIGSDLNSPSAYEMTGYLSNVRIVKGTALYTTNFTPPTAPVSNTNTTLYLPMDNAGIFDKIGNNTLIPVGNASTSTTQTKYADTAMYFDGSGDFIKFNEPNFSNNNFTFEFWIYRDGIQSVSDRVYQSRDGDVYVSISVSFYNATDIVVSLSSNGSSWDINESSLKTSLADQTWEHIAIVRSGSTISLYKNGLLVISITSTAALYYSGQTATIGGQTTGRNFTGYLENFQILKGVAKYTANFTPPNRTQGRTYQAES